MAIQYGLIGSQASLLAEVHRQELLREAGADRDDVVRHRQDLRRSRPRASPGRKGPLARVRRTVQRALLAYLALIAVAACGTAGSAGVAPDAGRQPDAARWHVASVDGSPERVSYPEDASANDRTATLAPGDYPPQERDVPEFSNLLRRSTASETGDDGCGIAPGAR